MLLMNNNYESITLFEQWAQLRDYRPATRYAYVYAVRKLAEHFGADPASLTEPQVREYFLFLREQRQYQGSAMIIARVALRGFFQEVTRTGRDWTVFAELRIGRPEPLPLVLSREEVARVLGAVRQPRFQICLRLIYHCGLRVGEAVRLAPVDVHGRQAPPYLHIRQGKGGKDRMVPIAAGMVAELRPWWKSHGNRRWLFPSPGAPGCRPPPEPGPKLHGCRLGAGGLCAGPPPERHSSGGYRAHPAPLLRHPSAGGRHQYPPAA